MNSRLGSVEKDVGGILKNLGGLQDELNDLGKSLDAASAAPDVTLSEQPKDS